MSEITQVAKVERNGLVAVIVSPGFGAGWSTWAHDHPAEALFSPEVVAWIEDGKPSDGRPEEFERFGYTGGLSQAEIEWVPVGTQFTVDEYDGSERLTIITPALGYIA